jgi:hypothetical protein
MQVKISDNNSKIGRMPNISLTPIASCRCNVPCRKDCYALKAYRQYPPTKAAWDNNYNMAKTDLAGFFSGIDQYLASKKKPAKYFRWHVSGDIISAEYLQGMVALASKHINTRFLAFTKQYEIVNNYTGSLPANLTLIFSAWPGLNFDNPKSLPIAYMQDGTESRVPENAIECPGNCEMCGMCWQLPQIGKDVVFHKH